MNASWVYQCDIAGHSGVRLIRPRISNAKLEFHFVSYHKGHFISSLYHPAKFRRLLRPPVKMSTLADELLNDFEDSGSEGDNDQHNDLFQDPDLSNGHSYSPNTNGTAGGVEMDVDEEDDDDEDQEMANVSLAEEEDEEVTKARIDKMQLGAVSDVRNVAGLMKTLEPVLEVSVISSHPIAHLELKVYIFREHSPDVSADIRKLHIISHYHRKSRQLSLDQLKTIPSIIFLPSPIHYQHLSITRSYLCTSSSATTIRPAFRSWKRLSRILSITPSQ